MESESECVRKCKRNKKEHNSTQHNTAQHIIIMDVLYLYFRLLVCVWECMLFSAFRSCTACSICVCWVSVCVSVCSIFVFHVYNYAYTGVFFCVPTLKHIRSKYTQAHHCDKINVHSRLIFALVEREPYFALYMYALYMYVWLAYTQPSHLKALAGTLCSLSGEARAQEVVRLVRQCTTGNSFTVAVSSRDSVRRHKLVILCFCMHTATWNTCLCACVCWQSGATSTAAALKSSGTQQQCSDIDRRIRRRHQKCIGPNAFFHHVLRRIMLAFWMSWG